MAQFTLQWDNTSILVNPNAVAQRVSYKERLAGGAFITTGFTPNNDLNKIDTTADSPVLGENKAYQFKVETICTLNGPTINDNGIQEIIVFLCISPIISGVTDTTATATWTVTDTDITKAKITLRKNSDNSIAGVTTIDRIGNTIVSSYISLLQNTNYYIQAEFYAIINTVEIISSDVTQIGAVCGPYPLTTQATPVCDPVSSVNVQSIEIP